MASAETKLEFNGLEAQGLFMQQKLHLEAKAQLERAQQVFEQAAARSARVLAGRVPEGVTIEHLRIDQRDDSVWAPMVLSIVKPGEPPAS